MNPPVLLPIHPEHIRKIESGEKRFEFRRRKIGKNQNFDVFVYETVPVKAIVGYFRAIRRKNDLDTLWKYSKADSGITEEQFREYFKGLYWGYSLSIIDYQKITPIPLEKIGIDRPPQNFMYLNKDQVLSIVENVYFGVV